MTPLERERIYQAALRQLIADANARRTLPESVIIDRVPAPSTLQDHAGVSPFFTLALQLACDEFTTALHGELDRR